MDRRFCVEVRMRVVLSIPFVALAVLGAVMPVSGAPQHSVEQRLCYAFPSISIDSSAAFEGTEEVVGGRLVPGLRAHTSESARPDLGVTYPRFYGDPLVVSLGRQSVVLRAMHAQSALAETGNGHLIYQEPYRSVDAVELPGDRRSEELLLLRDSRAPLVYEYEIVAMRGVSAVVADNGAVRFLPDSVEVPTVSQAAGGRSVRLPDILQIERPWIVDASGLRSETGAQWSVERAGNAPTVLRLTLTGDKLAYPIVLDPTFSAAGSLGTGRGQHTATLLPNGKILVAGGYPNAGPLASTEVYDPASGLFSAGANLLTSRELHTATLLPNGLVLIAGGFNGSYLASAELYDPSNGTVSATGSLQAARDQHTATLLPGGKVLIAGGRDSGGAVASAELYDPATGQFSTTGSLSTPRYLHTATLLPNGKVLVAGGFNA